MKAQKVVAFIIILGMGLCIISLANSVVFTVVSQLPSF